MSASGQGVVSHAGLVLLRELAEDTGLVEAVTDALADTYDGPWLHAPGRVFTDLAVAVADGADCVSGIEVWPDREGLFGQVASIPTAWRLVGRIDNRHVLRLAAACGLGRRVVWAAGAAPDPDTEQVVDIDATITVAHSEKENAAGTWKRTFGFHPLLAFLDRPEIASGEALAGILRPGNAGSNTAADHIEILHQALAALPDDRSGRVSSHSSKVCVPRTQSPDGSRSPLAIAAPARPGRRKDSTCRRDPRARSNRRARSAISCTTGPTAHDLTGPHARVRGCRRPE